MRRLFILTLLAFSVLAYAQQTKVKACRVLFIGDSVTDGGWGRSGGSMKPSGERNHTDQNHIYGHSFMMLCATHYESSLPDADWQFYNRGISGNTLAQIAQRWQSDALSLMPDVVTILVGINDVYEFMKTKKSNPDSTFDFASWEKQYRSLLDSLRANNSNIKIMIGAPFISNDGKNGKLSNYAEYDSMVSRLAAITKSIAHDYNAAFLPFNSMFAQLIAQQPRPGYWIWDGIHPTPAGHRRMADLWIRVFDNVRH